MNTRKVSRRGRPPIRTRPLLRLLIRATYAELERIKAIDPRRRAEILLSALNEEWKGESNETCKMVRSRK